MRGGRRRSYFWRCEVDRLSYRHDGKSCALAPISAEGDLLTVSDEGGATTSGRISRCPPKPRARRRSTGRLKRRSLAFAARIYG